MTTPVFDAFKTKAVVDAPLTGHFFKPDTQQQNVKFDAKGREKKITTPEEKKKEEEPSFISKYWMWILGAFLILPRLLEAPADGGQATAPAGGAAAARR